MMHTSIHRLVRCGSCYSLSEKKDLCTQCGMPLNPAKDITRSELQKKIKGDLE
jgi:ribosomal protein L37E